MFNNSDVEMDQITPLNTPEDYNQKQSISTLIVKDKTTQLNTCILISHLLLVICIIVYINYYTLPIIDKKLSKSLNKITSDINKLPKSLKHLSDSISYSTELSVDSINNLQITLNNTNNLLFKLSNLIKKNKN